MAGSGGNVVVGALVGFTANRTMDVATTWFLERQSEASRRREEELAPGGALVVVGKQVGEVLGRDLTDEQAARVGLALHRIIGVTLGMAAAGLVRLGVRPVLAGPVAGAAGWAVIDEGTALSQFTDYPFVSHMRGVVGYGTFGLVTGTLLALVDRFGPLRGTPTESEPD